MKITKGDVTLEFAVGEEDSALEVLRSLNGYVAHQPVPTPAQRRNRIKPQRSVTRTVYPAGLEVLKVLLANRSTDRNRAISRRKLLDDLGRDEGTTGAAMTRLLRQGYIIRPESGMYYLSSAGMKAARQ